MPSLPPNGVQGLVGCEYIYLSVSIYIYICATPLLSTHLGLLSRVFGVENLGLEMYMDESLGQVPESSSFAWFWPGRQTKSNPTILLIAIVSQKSQPVSQGQQSWPWRQSKSKMRAVVLSSARIIAPAKVKVRGLVMAIVIVQTKFMPQSES